MNMKTIAKLTGYSVSTVSKALSNSNDISKQTTEVIQKKAEELNYYMGKKKIRLENKKNCTYNIAILCPEIISLHYATMASYIFNRIREKGGNAEIIISGFDYECVKKIIEECVRNPGIDGIINLEEFVSYNKALPIPYISAATTRVNDCVTSDLDDGIFKAVEYLRVMGHNRIGYIGENNTFARKNMLIRALQKNNLQVNYDYFFESEKRFEAAGEAAINKMLEKNDRPTSFICAYDEIAFGAIRQLKNNNLSVPKDFSIIGINDIPLSSYINVSLTSINTHYTDVCDLVLELLDRKIRNPKYKIIQQISLKTDLIKRDSVTSIK